MVRRGAWEASAALLWTPHVSTPERMTMADEEEPLLEHPGTPEVARHVHDYEKFANMMKWGAIICLIIGLISLIIIKAYW